MKMRPLVAAVAAAVPAPGSVAETRCGDGGDRPRRLDSLAGCWSLPSG
jgi:hypothetical protein